MNRESVNWTGVMPAVTTPFTNAGAVDHDALSANISRLMNRGCTGVVSAGCTGEFWSLSLAEKAAIYKTTADTIGASGAKIVGAPAIMVDDVIAGADAAKDAGCDAILVTPPFFARLTDAETIAYFEAVDKRSPLPIVLYNIPGNAGNWLTPAIVDVLADLDNVVAIKESSGDWLNFHKTLTVAKDRIRVFCGPSSTIGVAATLAGCDGLIDCFPNVWEGCIDIWEETRQGRLDNAWKLQAFGQTLTHLFTSEGRTLYPATKAAMSHLDLPGGGPLRAPLLPLQGEALSDFLKKLDQVMQPRSSTV